MSMSIVTISFNQATFLVEAIESVLATAKSTDLELILIDPGSTDGSREIILEYAKCDDRVRYLFENDLGPADGLNKGFGLARKDYIGYINSDDYYLPGAIEEVDKLFNSNSEIAVLIGHGLKLQNKKFRIVVSDNFNAKAYAYERCNFLQQSTFYNRDILQSLKVEFNIHNRTCWDGEFLFDIALRHGKFKTIPRLWGVFRIHENSISGTGKLNDIYRDDRKRMTQRYFCETGVFQKSQFNFIFKTYRALLRRVKKAIIYARRDA